MLNHVRSSSYACASLFPIPSGSLSTSRLCLVLGHERSRTDARKQMQPGKLFNWTFADRC